MINVLFYAFLYLIILRDIMVQSVTIGSIKNASLTIFNTSSPVIRGTCRECMCAMLLNSNYSSFNCYTDNQTCHMHWKSDQNRSFQMVPSASTIFYFVSLPMSPASVAKMYIWSFDSNFNDQLSRLNFSAANSAGVSNVMTINGYGSSLSLNATQAQYLSNDVSFLNLADTSWTFELWIYLSELYHGKDSALIEQCQSRATRTCLHMVIRNYKAFFGFYSDDCEGNQTIEQSKWYHLAFTFDCQTKNQSIYVNGFLDAHRRASDCYHGQSGNLLVGGSLIRDFNASFKGFIDQLYYFDRVRTAKEILDDASLIVYFSFDNYSLKDQGPLGIDGEAGGSVNFTEGMIGDALQFDPISNGFVRMKGIILFGISNQSYSFSTWIRSSDRRNSTIVHVSDGNDGQGWCFPMLSLTDQGRLIAVSWSRIRRDLYGPIVPLNVWTHVTITYSLSVGLSIYTNGTLSNSSAAFPFTASGSTQHYLFLGSSVAGTSLCGDTPNYNGQYAGALDEFRLHSRALTADEIGDFAKH
jgi:hypothetical protein